MIMHKHPQALFVTDNKGMLYCYYQVDSFVYDDSTHLFSVNGYSDDRIKIGCNIMLSFTDLNSEDKIVLHTEEDAHKAVKYYREMMKRMKKKEIKDLTIEWEGCYVSCL